MPITLLFLSQQIIKQNILGFIESTEGYPKTWEGGRKFWPTQDNICDVFSCFNQVCIVTEQMPVIPTYNVGNSTNGPGIWVSNDQHAHMYTTSLRSNFNHWAITISCLWVPLDWRLKSFFWTSLWFCYKYGSVPKMTFYGLSRVRSIYVNINCKELGFWNL